MIGRSDLQPAMILMACCAEAPCRDNDPRQVPTPHQGRREIVRNDDATSYAPPVLATEYGEAAAADQVSWMSRLHMDS